MTEREGEKDRKIELGLIVYGRGNGGDTGKHITQMFFKRRTVSFHFNN